MEAMIGQMFRPVRDVRRRLGGNPGNRRERHNMRSHHPWSSREKKWEVPRRAMGT